jgi:hypothetical protein
MFLLTNWQLLIKSRISQTWYIENLRSFHKNPPLITVTNKIIQNVKNTEFNLINTVIGKNLLFTCRTDYVVHLSHFSRFHMHTHACSCWLLNLRLKETSPNQILKPWFKNVLFVIVILNEKPCLFYMVTIFLSSIIHKYSVNKSCILLRQFITTCFLLFQILLLSTSCVYPPIHFRTSECNYESHKRTNSYGSLLWS